jgi:hypothetical protein
MATISINVISVIGYNTKIYLNVIDDIINVIFLIFIVAIIVIINSFIFVSNMFSAMVLFII